MSAMNVHSEEWLMAKRVTFNYNFLSVHRKAEFVAKTNESKREEGLRKWKKAKEECV